VSNSKKQNDEFNKSTTLGKPDVSIKKNMRTFSDYILDSVKCYTPERQAHFLEYFTGFGVYSIFIIVLLYTLLSYSNPKRYPYYAPLDKTSRFAVTVVIYIIYVLFKVYQCHYQEHYWLFVPVAISAIALSAVVVMIGYFLVPFSTYFFETEITPFFLQVGVTKLLTRVSYGIVFIFFIYLLEIGVRYGLDSYPLVDSLPLKQSESTPIVETANGISNKTKGLRIIQFGVVTVLVV